jgi:glycerophosphoryl diester phosphodiesterase
MGYRPQSTLVTFEEAIRRGYHIVDADLFVTKDKIPVINHGDDIDQYSNGKGKISTKKLEELEELDFGEKFNKKYKGEKILTFEKLLELCKENNEIIDLDLAQLQFEKYFNNTNEYLKKIFDFIEKYDMFNSIFLNERRPEAILKLKEIKNDISFSIGGMNEKQNIEKIKDEYKGSKIIIYSMGQLMEGQTIKEDVVKYGLSLGKKIKAAKVDDIAFAEKIQSWGVNYITTNLLHPFLIKNEKEDPIVVRCSPSVIDKNESDCEIGDDAKLIDNEKYDIYYNN